MIGVVIGVFLLGTVWVQAQTATLEGRVTDAQGAVLAGVTVTTNSPVLAVPAVATSDATGAYAFPSLAPGVYSATFTLSGFESQRHEGVALVTAEPRVLNAVLVLAPFAERLDVVGVTPLLGADISRDQVAATVSVIDSDELEARAAPSLADSLNERLGSISLEGATTNLFQPTLRFRGFTASPLLGLPQGIAVYQNGVRINEPFGDTVQFDLIPQFAIDHVHLSAGADPAYGLNAMGGALALRLKNAFDHGGFRGELSGGSFDRVIGTAEFGANRGPWALYVGAMRFDETGWRVASPSKVTQAVADVGYREGWVDAGVSFTYADTSLSGNGAAPVELLAVDRSAVFTPDTTENRLGFVQGRVNLAASSNWSLQVIGYYRDLDRRTLNGDQAEFSVCDDDSLPPGAPDNTLCVRAADDDDDENASAAGAALMSDNEDPLVDVRTGRFITNADALGDGAFNRTTTLARGYGAAFQATATTELSERENVLIFGTSADLADIAFASNSEVGTMTPERTVARSGLLVGIFDEAPDDRFNTNIDTENRGFGLYFSDTLSLTDRTHVTVSGRYNSMRINIADQLGTSLNGRHTFSRFNPGVGTVYQASDAVSVFGRYSESNRAPTAAELSCADPAAPCRVPNAFVSDPPLEQVVARSIEGGVRGRWAVAGGTLEWSVAAYRARINDDVLFVASPELLGTGFFQNAGDTQRVGLDVDLSGRIAQFGWYASYGFVEATFESPLTLPGNQEVNDAANDDGEIEVEPGDRLPGIPRHSFKGGVQQEVTEAWHVAVETIVASSRVFLGDEGNDQAELEGYGVANLRSSYRFNPTVELFVRVENLFDKRYETFGALADLEIHLREAPDASQPQFVSPGVPRSAFAGLRVRF